MQEHFAGGGPIAVERRAFFERPMGPDEGSERSEMALIGRHDRDLLSLIASQ